MTDIHKISPERPRLYGRSKGRPLSPHQQSLMDDLFPKIECGDDPMADLSDYDEVWAEIGFGGSEHLIWQAQHNPNVALLGAEPFLNGVSKAVLSVHDDELKNIRLHMGDGRDMLDRVPDKSLSCIFVLFPDPWPKSRHNKRRIINPEFLSLVHAKLRPEGRFRFASDIIHYVDWTLTRVKVHGGLRFSPVTVSDWRQRPDDWPETRYEQKAKREGRPCHYFEFTRR